MPRPYSQDLRDRVVVSVADGRSRRATAKIFSVSVATVVRWSQRFRTTGSAAALAMGGHRPHRLASRRNWLLARIAEKPDLTLRAVMAELAADGVKVSYGALWGFFAREGITFKKEPARQRTGSRRHRPPARAVEEIPRPARRQTPGLY
jgi:transposase